MDIYGAMITKANNCKPIWYCANRKPGTQGVKVEGHTAPTIHNNADNARYSTPPSSSSCSRVRLWNTELRPTTASNEIYGTGRAPGPTVPRSDAIVRVRGMVIVRVSLRSRDGNARPNRREINSCGMGNPPKPLCIVRRGGNACEAPVVIVPVRGIVIGRDMVGRDIVGRDIVGRDIVGRDIVGRDIVGRDICPAQKMLYGLRHFRGGLNPLTTVDLRVRPFRGL